MREGVGERDGIDDGSKGLRVLEGEKRERERERRERRMATLHRIGRAGSRG